MGKWISKHSAHLVQTKEPWKICDSPGLDQKSCQSQDRTVPEFGSLALSLFSSGGTGYLRILKSREISDEICAPACCDVVCRYRYEFCLLY